jgi:hypothetical protein
LRKIQLPNLQNHNTTLDFIQKEDGKNRSNPRNHSPSTTTTTTVHTR